MANKIVMVPNVLNPQKETDRALVAFNEKVQQDPHVENVLLTVRDGMMLVRKNKP